MPGKSKLRAWRRTPEALAPPHTTAVEQAGWAAVVIACARGCPNGPSRLVARDADDVLEHIHDGELAGVAGRPAERNHEGATAGHELGRPVGLVAALRRPALTPHGCGGERADRARQPAEERAQRHVAVVVDGAIGATGSSEQRAVLAAHLLLAAGDAHDFDGAAWS